MSCCCLCFCCCLFVVVVVVFVVVVAVFFRDSNMISIGTVEFRYYVVITRLVNLGKP